MGLYLTPGHTYSDTSPNNAVNGANLNEHVSEAVLKTTAISSQTLKDPAALSDEILVNDGGSFKKETWQQVYSLMIQPGTTIQTAYGEYRAFTIMTSIIPTDDTIPQNTEGTEILNVSITPRFSNSTILCRFQGWHDSNPNTTNVVALFRGSVVDAIAAAIIAPAGVGWGTMMCLEVMDSPSTTSPITYSIRFGPGSAGNVYFNGITGLSRRLGGSARATLVLQEIKV